MEGKKKKKYCKFPGCRNSYTTGTINKHYYQFPKDLQAHQLWKDICRIQGSTDASHFVVCEDHFLVTDFMNENKNRLKPGTVPFAQCTDVADTDSIVNFPCSCAEPSTSSTVCACVDSHSENSNEIICESSLQDHDYVVRNFVEVPKRCDKFAFLNESNTGILGKIGLSKKDLTPTKNLMYKIHRNTTSKISKLRSLLEHEKNKVKLISDLYKNGRFKFIDDNLNSVTKEFINSQLRNCSKTSHARRWS